MTASRINIRHTPRGVTIRATGAAAQALADAITHGAESAQAAAKPLPVVLELIVDNRSNTYSARPVTPYTPAIVAAGLAGKRASCTAGEVQAIRTLLAKAEPPMDLVRLVTTHIGFPTKGCSLYTIEAEAQS